VSGGTALAWLRLDLRIEDNPVLSAASQGGRAVVPVFVWAPEEDGAWPPGQASRWWLARSLTSLDRDLRARGSRLVVRRGPSAAGLIEIARSVGADRVVWGARPEPALAARDRAVAAALRSNGLDPIVINSAFLAEPGTIVRGGGQPYRVFTPFWQACLAVSDEFGAAIAPPELRAPAIWPDRATVESLAIAPAAAWTARLAQRWTPGETAARKALGRFADAGVSAYEARRDRVDLEGTSELSAHLHHGEVGPHQVWRALRRRPGADAFLRQLGWREFGYHLLVHFPRTTDEPLRPEFARLPWREDEAEFDAWRRGRTGFALVDAGMRQLWETGWMHNRARMVAASFLVKDLLVDWRRGARWFWDTLVDGDLANNTLGWQWVAGCGSDAAPYFRVLNPDLQAQRFDPDGVYRARWARAVPAAPMLDHSEARARALAAFETVRAKVKPPPGSRGHRPTRSTAVARSTTAALTSAAGCPTRPARPAATSPRGSSPCRSSRRRGSRASGRSSRTAGPW